MRQSITQYGKSPNGIRHNDAVLEHFCLTSGYLEVVDFMKFLTENFRGFFRFWLKYIRNADFLNANTIKEYWFTTVQLLLFAHQKMRREYWNNCLIGFSNPSTSNGFPDLSVSGENPTKFLIPVPFYLWSQACKRISVGPFHNNILTCLSNNIFLLKKTFTYGWERSNFNPFT
jgi:hypothetical protein